MGIQCCCFGIGHMHVERVIYCRLWRDRKTTEDRQKIRVSNGFRFFSFFYNLLFVHDFRLQNTCRKSDLTSF